MTSVCPCGCDDPARGPSQVNRQGQGLQPALHIRLQKLLKGSATLAPSESKCLMITSSYQPKMSFIIISRRLSRKSESPGWSLENLSEIIGLAGNQCNCAHIPPPYFSDACHVYLSGIVPMPVINTTDVFVSQESLAQSGVQLLWAGLPHSAGLACVSVGSWQVG